MTPRIIIIYILATLTFQPCVTIGQTTLIPDTTFEQALIDLGYDTLLDGTVLTDSISSITFLSVNGQDIFDLTGIQDFSSLTQLQVFKTQLTSLDVSSNSQLSVLDCGLSQLTSLTLGNISTLTELWCDSNQLTSLDVSANTLLMYFFCDKNQLRCLTLGSIQMSNFYAFDNPNLNCIQVDDTVWATTNYTVANGNIDSTASFGQGCNYDTPCNWVSIEDEEHPTSNKELLLISDILGRPSLPNPNQILIYKFKDGRVEKRIILD